MATARGDIYHELITFNGGGGNHGAFLNRDLSSLEVFSPHLQLYCAKPCNSTEHTFVKHAFGVVKSFSTHRISRFNGMLFLEPCFVKGTQQNMFEKSHLLYVCVSAMSFNKLCGGRNLCRSYNTSRFCILCNVCSCFCMSWSINFMT